MSEEKRKKGINWAGIGMVFLAIIAIRAVKLMVSSSGRNTQAEPEGEIVSGADFRRMIELEKTQIDFAANETVIVNGVRKSPAEYSGLVSIWKQTKPMISIFSDGSAAAVAAIKQLEESRSFTSLQMRNTPQQAQQDAEPDL